MKNRLDEWSGPLCGVSRRMIASAKKITIVLPHNVYVLFLLTILGLEIIQPRSYVFKINETQEDNGSFEATTKAERWEPQIYWDYVDDR